MTETSKTPKLTAAQRKIVLASQGRLASHGGGFYERGEIPSWTLKRSVEAMVRAGFAYVTRHPSGRIKEAVITRAALIAAGVDMDAAHGEALREDAVREADAASAHQLHPSHRRFNAAVIEGKSYRAALDILHAEALAEYLAWGIEQAGERVEVQTETMTALELRNRITDYRGAEVSFELPGTHTIKRGVLADVWAVGGYSMHITLEGDRLGTSCFVRNHARITVQRLDARTRLQRDLAELTEAIEAGFDSARKCGLAQGDGTVGSVEVARRVHMTAVAEVGMLLEKIRNTYETEGK